MKRTILLAFAVALPLAAQQTPAPQTPDPSAGKVIIENGHTPEEQSPDAFPKEPVTNDERAALTIASTDLNLHLIPSGQRLEAHALLTIRNTSDAPLKRIPIQITSTLRWQSFAARNKPVAFTQSPITTDADHTGYAQEAVLTPEHPLKPGDTLTLSVFYSGQIPASTSRLELIGTPAVKAAETDWDAIAPTSDETATALRGYGEVLWYPCAAPTALLGEGNQLFASIARERQRNLSATMRLSLTVVYAGDPPDAAILNGHLQSLTKTPDDANQLVDETHGVATADFPLAPVGFRTPNLFLTAQHPSKTDSPLLTVVTPVPEAAESYAAAVESLKPLFNDWLAPTPTAPLLLLEHPGAPFEDASFVAAHLSPSAEPENIAPELVRPLTHSFFADPAPSAVWLDQGMPEFMSLLWTERSKGRDAAIAVLQQNAAPLALLEPDFAATPTATGTPLIQASSDVLLHFKSAAVLWQLRDILGDETLRRAITTYRQTLATSKSTSNDPAAFQKSLEHTASTDLSWFFNDWVYNDRGLPDLTITQVTPRPILPKTGRAGGYLIAIDIRNDGFAAAEVPVTVRSGTLSASNRLRIPGHSTASTRIVFEGSPDTLQVNDGTVPELRTSIHQMPIKLEPTVK